MSSVLTHVGCAVVASVLLGVATIASAAPITYGTDLVVDRNTLAETTLIGTFTTDGTLGELAESNVLTWSFTIRHGVLADMFTPANSYISHLSGVSATPTEWTLDTPAKFTIAGVFPPPFFSQWTGSSILDADTTQARPSLWIADLPRGFYALNDGTVTAPIFDGLATNGSSIPAPEPMSFGLLVTALWVARSRLRPQRQPPEPNNGTAKNWRWPRSNLNKAVFNK